MHMEAGKPAAPAVTRVLGIDPGTAVMGYGIIDGKDDEMDLVTYGAINSKKNSPPDERLNHIFARLTELIERHRPDVVAVEQPFVAQNVRSAFAIGRAQAVAILAAAVRGIPTREYTPAQVKQRVANYGASSKEQMQEMVRLQLELDATPEPHDAADALAVAICHLRELHLNRLLSSQEKP